MAKRIFWIYKSIIILKILFPSIIRRINIYYVNLALVSISESSERFEVVTLDKYMVGRIRRIAHDGTLLYLRENGQFIHKTCFYFFWLVLPHQAILLLRTKKLNKRSLFFVCQAFELRYLFRKFIFIHIQRSVSLECRELLFFSVIE